MVYSTIGLHNLRPANKSVSQLFVASGTNEKSVKANHGLNLETTETLHPHGSGEGRVHRSSRLFALIHYSQPEAVILYCRVHPTGTKDLLSAAKCNKIGHFFLAGPDYRTLPLIQPGLIGLRDISNLLERCCTRCPVPVPRLRRFRGFSDSSKTAVS